MAASLPLGGMTTIQGGDDGGRGDSYRGGGSGLPVKAGSYTPAAWARLTIPETREGVRIAQPKRKFCSVIVIQRTSSLLEQRRSLRSCKQRLNVRPA